MLPDGRRLGAHLPLGAGMVKAVERAHAIGADALQVFADNPTAWRRRTNPPKEAAAFRHRLAELGIAPVAIHAAYLVNLAGPDDDLFSQSVAVLANELRVAPDFAARFVNVHVGSHRGTGVAAGIARVAEGLRLVFAEVDAAPDAPGSLDDPPAQTGSLDDPPGRSDGPHGLPVLVLENSAGGGFGIGATVEELAAIADAAAAVGVGPDRLGFCLDTAHAWGAGYEISEPDEVNALVEAFAERIGIERLRMIHLNDSKAPLGQNADRHEHLGAGSIGPRGLARVLTHPALAHVAYYLETPGMEEGYDAINLARALAMARGEPLPELPPEATLVRGSRARSAPPVDPETEEP